MSVESLAIVLHHSAAKGTDKVVLLGIANHDGDGGSWPKVETLAKYANVARSTVQESLTRLIASGELVRHKQAGGTHKTRPGFRPNSYEIMVTCPPECDGTTQHRVTPLPMAPAGLWISGARPTGPHAGGARPTGHGGARPTGHEPSIEPSTNTGSRSVTDPEPGAGTTPPCTECSAPDLAACLRRQSKLAAKDRHSYSARPW